MANIIEVIIKARDELSGTLRSATGELGEFGGFVKKHAGAIRGVGVAMTAAGAAGIAFAASSVRAAGEQQEAEAKLAAVLKATGKFTEEGQKSLVDYATELQKTTVVGDEQSLSAMAMLATFKLTPDAIKEATQALTDMTALTGQDMTSAAIQLGKAMADPIGQATALRRVGVMINKDMLEGLSIEQQRAVILKELRSEFGGAAAAVAATPFGQWKQFLNTLSDFQETVGGALGPALKAIVPSLTRIVELFGKFVTEHPKIALMGVALAGVAAAMGPLLIALPSIVSLISMLGASGMGASLAGIFAGGVGGIGAMFASLAAAIVPVLPALTALAAALWLVTEAIKRFGEMRQAQEQAKADEKQAAELATLMGAGGEGAAFRGPDPSKKLAGESWAQFLARKGWTQSTPDFDVQVNVTQRRAAHTQQQLAMRGA